MDQIAEPGKYVEALQAENEKLRAEVETLKDQGRTACNLFDDLKAAQLQNQELQKIIDRAYPIVEAARDLIGMNVNRPEVYLESDRNKHRLAVALQSLTEKRKCPPHYWVGKSRQEAECSICGKQKCGAEHAAGGAICGLDKGHDGRHSDMVMAISWANFG